MQGLSGVLFQMRASKLYLDLPARRGINGNLPTLHDWYLVLADLVTLG